MKQIILLLLTFGLLVITPISAFTPNIKSENISDFSPQDITLRDDAFHGYSTRPCMEWWYFDVSCDNGYSAQIGISVLGILGKGLVFERLTIYKNTTFIKRHAESYPLTELYASLDMPFVQIQGKTLLAGTRNNTTGNLEYTVSLNFSDCGVELHYVGCMKGWKTQHLSRDWWAVVLPRAEVTGSITIDNETMNINGTGYHDHNWGITGRSYLKYGWFWGKCSSPNYTAIWSMDFLTRVIYQPILVVNIKNAGYIGIPMEKIQFSAKDHHLNHLKLVPYFFTIKTITDNVLLVLNMEVVNVDYQQVMGLIHYWRYHVKCTGIIMINGNAETVNGVFIVEFGQLQ